MKKCNVFLAAVLGVFLAVSPLSAEDKEEKKLPKSGSLSVSSSGTSASKNLPDPWGGIDVTGEKAPPISGSVSKVSGRQWIARVFNNSDDTYSVSLAVHQYNRNNQKIKSDSFSATLKPKEKIERPITANANTEQCSLDLVNWTLRSSPKKKEEEEEKK